MPFLLQGIATVHFFLGATRNPQTWLGLFYAAFSLALFVFPFVVQILILLAIAEAIFRLRSRAPAA